MTYRIKIRSLMRGYRYEAAVSKRGKLLRITAGCRQWKDFATAFGHYKGGPGGDNKWSDAYVYTASSRFYYNESYRQFAYRMEARSILSELDKRVHRFQKSLRTQRRKKKR